MAVMCPREKFELFLVIVGGALMPIVGMVFPPLLHLMLHFQSIEVTGKFNFILFLDVFLMIIGLYISVSSITYTALKMKEINNSFLDVHVKPFN